MSTFGLTAICALMLPLTVAAQSFEVGVVEIPVYATGSNEADPALDGDFTVFTTDQIDTCDILITLGGPTQILGVGPGCQEHADIDGDFVVFENDATGNNEINLYTISTSTTVTLFGHPAADLDPVISDGVVVWVTRRSGNDDLMGYDLNKGVQLLLAHTPNLEVTPAIDGRLLAWQVQEGTTKDIYAVDLDVGLTFPVATDPSLNEKLPSVSGDLIAFDRDGEVAVYDVATGTTTQVTSNGAKKYGICAAENCVVWSDDRTGVYQVYLYSLIAGAEQKLTDSEHGYFVSDTDGDRLAITKLNGTDFDVVQLIVDLNHAPAADAGPDQNVTVGTLVHLAGAGSDPDVSDGLSYLWSVESLPPGSAAALSDETDPDATFVSDEPGDYVFSLQAHDGSLFSTPDVVTVHAFLPGSWADLGHGLPGTHGVPVLQGFGPLVAGSAVTTTVTGLLEDQVATLVLGLSAIDAPFKGGVWVPALDFLIPGIPTGPDGAIDLPTTWPSGVPSGVSVYEQYWLVDPGGPNGFAASNAVQATVP